MTSPDSRSRPAGRDVCGLLVREIAGIAWSEPPAIVAEPPVSYLGCAEKRPAAQ